MSENACPPDAAGRSTAPATVLFVEDSLIIALDTEDMLRELGVETVLSAETAGRALAILEQQRPEFALLDIELGDADSFAVAKRATELGIRYAFTTGHGDNRSFPSDFANVPLVQKPYGIDSLRRIVCRPA